MRWLMRLIRRERLERDLDAELRFHVEEEVERQVDAGVPAPLARQRALAAFGGLEPMKEYTRDARRTGWLEDLIKDTRYAGRMMRRYPGFTLAAILSLALGIGANTAIFSVADALLLRSLPVTRPSELTFLSRAGYDEQILRFSYPMYLKFRDGVPEAGVAAMGSMSRVQATINGSNELIFGQLVTGNWFEVAGVSAAEGRLMTDADTKDVGSGAVAVLSHRYWTRRFGASPSVIGTTIALNGLPLTIVGVAPREFAGLTVGERVDIWLPVSLQHELHLVGNASINDADGRKPWLTQDGIDFLTVVARVPDSLGVAAATARFGAVRRPVREAVAGAIEDPERRAYVLRERLELLPGARGLSPMRAYFTSPLALLMTTVAIVLVIGCANLASLLLARGAARGREFALRLSLGARRGRVVRQLLTESIALAGLGGLAGLAVARWGSGLLLQLASSGSSAIPLDVAVDWRVVAFALVVSVLTGVAFGLVPAIRLARTDVGDAIKSGGRVIGTARRGPFPLGKSLVVVQVALALTLLVGAVLFLRTFHNLLQVDTGFERDRIVTARFDPRLAQISEDQLPALYDRLLAETRRLPGVHGASLALAGAATGSQRISSYVAGGKPQRPAGEDTAREEYVEPGYFELMSIPLLRGRAFGPQDGAKAPDVIVINESLARKFFGDEDPLGQHMGYDTPAKMEIIGVVRDARIDGLRDAPPPMIYHSLRQHPDEFARNLYVRMSGRAPAEGIKASLARAMIAAAPNLAVREIVTLGELAERTVANERLISRLTAGFGLLAVFVACLGLYATVSYSVARRTNEIGVRLALGADPGQVRALVLRETTTLVAIGSALGLGLGLAVLGYARSLLYGLSPRDPATLAGSALTLFTLGVVAGIVPAWRASRVDPLSALRNE
jgi:predicted permease